ncbi:hypothetical protein [uncultured Aggregatibacter sp.]|uniref:hypothetical protein n=1 Tax=uncultured Aggregatibacter sp. TaxID=470564 RepID=UPI0025959BE1|nr:hypothetical protein [uncultured Aggregatibacter sp.]
MKKLIIAAVIAIFGLIWMLYMSAVLSVKTQHTSATDYYNNGVSEQISAEWERKAKAEWIAEFGDAQPNLTTESRVYLEQETARLQAERNGN